MFINFFAKNIIMHRPKVIYLLPLFLLIVLFSCQENQPDVKVKANSEVFEINCNKEYVLELKNGDVVVIDSNSFDCGGASSFSLTIEYVKSRKDIIFSGLETITDDGKLLESEGMFRLDYPSTVSIDKKSPVSYRVASKNYNSKAQLFDLDVESNSWTVREKRELTQEKIDRIENGAKLFDENCASCHNKKLDEPMTGPALGRVTEFRDLDWLLPYTRNSLAMIASGDSLAINLFNGYCKVIMTSFENLSDDEILSIYEFIENESEVQNIPLNPSNFIYLDDCGSTEEGHTSSSGGAEQLESSITYYNADILSRAWTNVDFFIQFDYEISTPRMKVKNDLKNFHSVLAFTNYNAVMRFYKENGAYFLKNSFGKRQINWPENEEVFVISFQLDDTGNVIAGAVDKFVFDKNANNLEVELEEMDFEGLERKIEELNIKD